MEWIPSVGLLRWLSSTIKKCLNHLQPEHLLVRRIIRVCQAHNINRTQICRIFPDYNLSPTSFATIHDAKSSITSNLITEIAETFNINRNWLEGNAADISHSACTYSSKSCIEDQLLQVSKLESYSHHRFLCLIAPSDIDLKHFDTYETNYPIAIAYRVTHDRDGVTFDTYHGCEVLCWDYQKSRIHLRAILQLADACNFQMRGAYVPLPKIQRYYDGKLCFAELLKYRKKPFDPWSAILHNKNQSEEKLLEEYLANS